MAKFIIAVDTGGTFTDLFCYDAERGKLYSYKTSSTSPDFERGVLTGVRGMAKELDISVENLMRDCISFVHGSTVVVNTMITRKGAKAGLIATRGCRDVLFIAGGAWAKTIGISWDEFRHFGMLDKPEPLIPKTLVKEIDERVDYKGDILIPLNKAQVEEVVEGLINEGVESIAVCLLWSCKNPAHEQEVRDIILKKKSDMEVTLSSVMSPIVGEFMRTSTAVSNAYTITTFRRYITTLESELHRMGYRYPLLVMESSGGSSTAELIKNRPVFTVGSGPIGGIIGSDFIGGMIGYENIITTDMGGTSFDASLIVGGEPLMKEASRVERFPLAISSVDVDSIGSGGGSIIWVDPVGALKVGPKSAGAVPGPACYDMGGDEPTVTDADVILGYINPDYFLGGAQKINKKKAEEAFALVASKLNMGAMEVAAGAVKVAESQMADMLRRKSVGLGYDPRDFVLFAYGGAGPTHCTGYARELGAKEIIVPLGNTASSLSAFGLSVAPMLHLEVIAEPQRSPFDASRLKGAFERLEGKCIEFMSRQGMSREKVRLSRELDMRYIGQIWVIEVEIPGGELTKEVVEKVSERFYKRYEELFGKEAGFRGMCEIINVRVKAIGGRPVVRVPKLAMPPKDRNLIKGSRVVFWEERVDFVMTDIYDGSVLGEGDILDGPAIIELAHTTVVIREKDRAAIDPYGNIKITIGG